MSGFRFCLALALLCSSSNQVLQQGVDSRSQSIFDALTTSLTCGEFKSLIIGAGTQTQSLYSSTGQLTVFVPNDTAFAQMTVSRRNKILNLSSIEKDDYVKSFTINQLLQTEHMNDNLMHRSMAGSGNKIFFNKPTRRYNDIISGTAGRTQYFINGALILYPDIRASNGIIHVIDRVLDQSQSKTVYGYVRQPDSQNTNKQMKFFTEILGYITGDEYNKAITPLQGGRITVFVPTDKAIENIPNEKLNELRSKQKDLASVVKQHIIPSGTVYTSFVYHNEGYQTLYKLAIFRKNVRDQVFISAGGVNAEIVHGNMTVFNGVIHFIDNLLGFVYNSAREQIRLGTESRKFEQLTNEGRKDLQDFLSRPGGVTVFVPVNKAFQNVANLPGVDFHNNQFLINKVLELSMLVPGEAFEISKVNGDYNAKFEAESQYRGYKVKIYSQGNETWAEGGHVKTRVIRPDIGVTNGFIHYIDGIFGVPSRDVPGLVFCEDWLIKSFYVLSITGLNEFLKDTRIKTALPACSYNNQLWNFNYQSVNSQRNSGPVKANTNQPSGISRGGCGESNTLCNFTVFVPNGTAVDDFQRSGSGRRLFQDPNRLRYVLKRHITQQRVLYIDQIGTGYHFLKSLTGDEIRLNKISNTYSEVVFAGARARIIHSDLGATNGVVHIVDGWLFLQEDLMRDISAGQRNKYMLFFSLLMTSTSLMLTFL